jgi:hypothetical protein
VRRTRVIAVALAAALALAMVAVPIWVIHPFRAQTPAGLAWSYHLRAWSPLATAVLAGAVLVLVATLWRGARRLGKVGLGLALALTLGAAFFARQNHFEWMFAPLRSPQYARASEVDFLDDHDMVLSVVIDGEAAAYPVRQLAYNHLVQDTVGGEPIVSTY